MTKDSKQAGQEARYPITYDGDMTKQIIEGRTAESHGAFFLTQLRSGMSLLDCGCGPGTITVGLAQAVAPAAECSTGGVCRT